MKYDLTNASIRQAPPSLGGAGGGRALACASLAVLSWSTVATAFKLALVSLSHFEMLLIASWTSLIIFALLITVQRKWKQVFSLFKRRWKHYALLGLLNPVAYYLVLFKSYELLPAQVAQPINYMWPILLTLMLAVFAHRAIPRIKYIGLLISLCGVVFVSMGSEIGGGMKLPVSGLLLAALSALLWAVYWMINDKDKDKADPNMSLFLCFLFGSAYLLIMHGAQCSMHNWLTPFLQSIIGQPQGLPIRLDGAMAQADSSSFLSHPSSIFWAIYVGCFEMGVPFIAFGYAIRKTSNTALINQLCYLAPFLSLFFIAVVLGETIVVTTYIGLSLIVAGILFNQYIPKKKTIK